MARTGRDLARDLGFPEPRRLIRKGGTKPVKLGDRDPGDDFFFTRFLLRPTRAVFSENDQRAASQIGKRGLTQPFRDLGQGRTGQCCYGLQKRPLPV